MEIVAEEQNTKSDATPKLPSTETMLTNMKLRRILKENHTSPIYGIAFNKIGHHKNLVGTVGKNQANIYDNLHVGENFDLMCNYVNIKTDYTDGGNLNVCTWLDSKSTTDSLLAVAGDSQDINVISVQDSRVKYLLKGHKASIVALCPLKRSEKNDYCNLASASKDNFICVWNAEEEKCLYRVECTAPTSIAAHPTLSNTIFSANVNGEVHLWTLEGGLTSSNNAGKAVKKKRKLQKITKNASPQYPKTITHGGVLGCSAKGIEINQLIATERQLSTSDTFTILVSKTTRGQIDVFDVNAETLEAGVSKDRMTTFKLEDDTGLCMMDVTSDGEYVCGGDDDGTVFVKHILSGKLIAELEYHRIKGQIQDIAISTDSKYILFTTEYGLIFRFDFDRVQAALDIAPEKKNADIAN